MKKVINGILHRECVECGEWYIAGGNIARCKEHQREYIRKYRESKKLKQREYRNSFTNTEARIQKELAGELPVTDLYDGCSREKINAMISGDVEALLRCED